MSQDRKSRGTRWLELQRSPRYDIWVSRTQVASPWLYHPACMTLWDGALGRPMTQLHGQAAGDVVDDVARAARVLRSRPAVPWSGDAARMLEVMRHLSTSDPAWIVQVETPAVVSYFELATGVLNGAIIREQAVRAARERGGAECDVRKMLNWAEAVMDHEAESALRRGCSPAGSRKRRASR